MTFDSRKSILILLAGSLWNDSRVLKTAETLSEKYRVTVWAYRGGQAENVPYTVETFEDRKSLLNRILERSCFWFPFHRNTVSARKKAMAFDLIWANDLNTLYTGAKLAERLDARLIYDSHEIFVETINQFFPSGTMGLRKLFHKINCQIMKRLGKTMERKMGGMADHVFAANDSFRNVLKERYRWSSLSSLYNFPTQKDIEKRDVPNDIRDGLSKDNILILYHGAFNSGRGLELLIECMNVLPKKFKLVLIGKGFLQGRLEQLITVHKLEERIRILPMVREKELINFIRGADIGINLLEKFNLSKWLASPNKLFQYIHAGIPVVCSNSPENLKVMETHNIGVVVENNIESLTQGIIELSEKLKYFPRELVIKVAQSYTWDSSSIQLLQKVEVLLQIPKSGIKLDLHHEGVTPNRNG